MTKRHDRDGRQDREESESPARRQLLESLTFDESLITGTDCVEEPSGQIVGSGTYAPSTENCGPGVATQDVFSIPGIARLVEQERILGTPASSGTLILGTVTFHAMSPTPLTGINSVLAEFGLGGGFVGADFILRNPGIPLGTVTLKIIPEPTTLALLGLGILGLGLSSRRLRRR